MKEITPSCERNFIDTNIRIFSGTHFIDHSLFGSRNPYKQLLSLKDQLCERHQQTNIVGVPMRAAALAMRSIAVYTLQKNQFSLYVSFAERSNFIKQFIQLQVIKFFFFSKVIK